MVVQIDRGNGNRDRDVILSQAARGAQRLLANYASNPQGGSYPGNRWHADSRPITTKVLWIAWNSRQARWAETGGSDQVT